MSLMSLSWKTYEKVDCMMESNLLYTHESFAMEASGLAYSSPLFHLAYIAQQKIRTRLETYLESPGNVLDRPKGDSHQAPNV